MSIFTNLFGGKTLGKPAVPTSTPQSLVVAAQLPKGADKRALLLVGLRRGMWVVVNETAVGIVTGVLPHGENDDPTPLVVVQYTDELGLNLASVKVPPQRVRQAAWKDIPEARRPEPDVAASMGYRL